MYDLVDIYNMIQYEFDTGIYNETTMNHDYDDGPICESTLEALDIEPCL